MAINGSGIRDASKVLGISKTTVINTLKKKGNGLVQVNPNIQKIAPETGAVVHVSLVCQEAEIDEQWSYLFKKNHQHSLWYAIDHATNTVLAYVFGRRKDEIFQKLKELLEPFGINNFYTDDWRACGHNLDENAYIIGKQNTRKIERKNLNFRAWIKRLASKTICFSKLEKMHDIVIGLLINKVEFGIDIHRI